jgi:hypothetical protein
MNSEPAPCDISECPYTPSPGSEGKLAPGNRYIVWLWERWQSLGADLWQLVELPSVFDRHSLVDALTLLNTHSARLRADLAARLGAHARANNSSGF